MYIDNIVIQKGFYWQQISKNEPKELCYADGIFLYDRLLILDF